jgi:hypothetical protein
MFTIVSVPLFIPSLLASFIQNSRLTLTPHSGQGLGFSGGGSSPPWLTSTALVEAAIMTGADGVVELL